MTNACWLSSLSCQRKESLCKQQASVLGALACRRTPQQSAAQNSNLLQPAKKLQEVCRLDLDLDCWTAPSTFEKLKAGPGAAKPYSWGFKIGDVIPKDLLSHVALPVGDATVLHSFQQCI